MDFSLPPVKVNTDKLYDQTMIANELGIIFTSGKSHVQAVGAIVDMVQDWLKDSGYPKTI